MTAPDAPALSVIVPTLDEAENLPDLFRMLLAQRQVDFELVLSDGGSTDATAGLARELADGVPFPCRVINSEPGRARQLNAGAEAARGKTLLFLHADSCFADPLALQRGLATLDQRLRQRGDGRAAGRFALRFRRAAGRPSPGYYFYECKARLDRPGCIHGDQGFLLRRALFEKVGPFDDSLPVLEDDRLAERVRQIGEWLLLPAEIYTSARRFESEGLRERQILNALLMNFAAVGWQGFFAKASGLYRRQTRTNRLHLYPFFQLVRDLLRQNSWRRRFTFWYLTGGYVRDNAWQIALALDVRRSFRRGLPPGTGDTPILAHFDRWLEPVIDTPPGRFAGTLLVWCWFWTTWWQLVRREKDLLRRGTGKGV